MKTLRKSYKNLSIANWLNKIEQGLLWLLPIVVFFSFRPVFNLGANETMNFELSLPLIWLFLFGVLSLRKMPNIWQKKTWPQRLAWLAIPLYATASICWSENKLRGVLVSGILWLITLTILNILSMKLKRDKVIKLLRIHIYTGVGVALYCIWQCIMDVVGVDRSITGLCAGCTYQTIGFPHPNGFAIEPQFMGNLLVLPSILSLVFGYYDIKNKQSKKKILLDFLLTFILVMVLFVSFSRGAIYSFMLAVICFVAYACGKVHKFSTLWVFPLLCAIFGVSLLFQGLLAELSPTNESFRHGVSRSIEQMSLGVIDFNEDITPETAFDGYIEESTEIRLSLNEAALKAWGSSPIVGVGLGGAGMVIHRAENSLSSKEIVQNEYYQILLELGLVGAVIILIIAYLVIRQLWGQNGRFVVFNCILIAYLASMAFYSGLPNVLHIYLITPLAYLLFLQSNMLKLINE